MISWAGFAPIMLSPLSYTHLIGRMMTIITHNRDLQTSFCALHLRVMSHTLRDKVSVIFKGIAIILELTF